jgi:hypothetical protein
MHAVMKELPGVELVNKPGMKFKIIQHDDVTEALRPLYLKHGILQSVSVASSRQLDGGTTELEVIVRWTNIDEPTEMVTVTSYGHASPAKQGPEMRRDDLGVGKALSYAVKMAQLKNFALLSGDGDLETESAKEPPKAASVEQIETAMNALASATTPAEFQAAAGLAASLTGLTAEQKGIMGNAWKAAKDRTSKPVAEQSAPLPESLGGNPNPSTYEKITGNTHMDPSLVADLMLEYSKVRTRGEFSVLRKKVSGLMAQFSDAQKQILKEKDDAASNRLKAQEEASQ